MAGRVRLDRALSKLGLASRSEARALIASGSVVVSGRIVTDPARLVVPERTAIVIDGTRASKSEWRTIALHKTRGTITVSKTASQDEAVAAAMAEANVAKFVNGPVKRVIFVPGRMLNLVV